MARLAVAATLVICGLVIASVSEASPIRTCPSTCFCRHTPTVKKADCRDIPEWDLKTSDAQVVRIIPPLHPVASSPLFLSRLDMFPKVQMLSVTNRSIVELTSGSLPTLQVLDLSHNQISRFNERTFHHMPALRQLTLANNPVSLKKGIPLLISSSIRTLDLGSCGLSHIPNGSLSGIPNLTSLYLQGNPLKFQEGFPLVDRTSIQELDLSSCKLTRIPNHSLSNLVNLRRLYLTGNELKTISIGALPLALYHLDLSANRIRDVPLTALSALKNLTKLELAKNPVICSCDFIHFLDRLSEHNVVSEKLILCAEPEKYAKIPWKDINERELCDEDSASEESTDESPDDDTSSTSVSFENHDVSYETDGPPEEENRIISQHPLPFSLEKLLQKPSRYQNMEENSIQSDQPYSNTSDEGADHTNDSHAAHVKTDLQAGVADEQIEAASKATELDSGTDGGTSMKESYEEKSSEEKLDIEMSKKKEEAEDSRIDPTPTINEDDTRKAVVSTESSKTSATTTHHGEHEVSKETEDSGDSSIIPPSVAGKESSRESKATPKDRETLEDQEEQEEDLIKAPNASIAVDEHLESPVRSGEASEESTEDPDAETFMKNEETIAMGKLMPEKKEASSENKVGNRKSGEDVEQPLLLASKSEGQAKGEIETNRSVESEETHSSVHDNSEELHKPQSDEVGRSESNPVSSSDEVVSSSAATEETTAESIRRDPTRSGEVTSEENSKLITQSGSEEPSLNHVTDQPTHSQKAENHGGSLLTVASPLPTEKTDVHVTTDSESLHKNSHEGARDGVPTEDILDTSRPVESAENELEVGRSSEPRQTSSTETSHQTSGEIGLPAVDGVQAPSDDTKAEKSSTESTGYEHMFSPLNGNTSPEVAHSPIDKTESHQTLSGISLPYEDIELDGKTGSDHKHGDPMKQPILTTAEPPTTPGPSKETTETVHSSSFSIFDDIEAEMASLYPDTPSTTERQEKPVEVTTHPTVESVTEKKAESEGGVFSIFNPFSFIPSSKSENKPPSAVSEPSGFPAETSHNEDLIVENNSARLSESDTVVAGEDYSETATMAYAVIAGVVVCIIVAVACVVVRTRSNKKRKGSAPVRKRGDNVSPGTEMKDMMNPLLEPIVEGQAANEFHDDPTRCPSLTSIDLNEKFPVISPVSKENGVSEKDRTCNGGSQNGSFKPISVDDNGDVTEVVIEADEPNGVSSPPSLNGHSAPINGKPPRQNGNVASKVKVVAGMIPAAVPRAPVYVQKMMGES